jgi:hypothetical protein
LGEKIETIIQIDEKLSEKGALKIELNKQTNNYQQLAEERNKLVLERIKSINIEKMVQIIPQVEKSEIKQVFESSENYEQLARARNQLIVKYLKQDLKEQQKELAPNQPTLLVSKERIIWVSLLVISLLTIGGLLVKIRRGKSSNKRV